MKCRHAISLLLGALLPTLASAESAPSAPPVGSAERDAPARPLTLLAAAQEATRTNQGLLVSRLDARRAALNVPATHGAFLPLLRVSTTASDLKGPRTALPDVRALDGKAEVRYESPFGTQAGVAVTHRMADETPTSLMPPNPSRGAGVSLDVTQPILQGAGRAGTGSALREAEVEARLQGALYLQTLDDFLAEVDAAYWDLALAQADVEIRTRSRDRARTQADETNENIRRGLLATTEAYIVEESLDSFEQALVEAEETRAQAASRLSRLLELPPGTDVTATESLSTAGGAESAPPPLTAAVETALAQSPALHGARLALEREHVRLAYTEDRALPTLDLSATLALNGFADGTAGAFGDLSTSRNRALTAGLLFSLPLLPDGQDAAVERGRLAVAQQVAGLSRAETDLRYKLADTLRARAAHGKGLTLARQVVKLSELKLTAERQKYQSGLSTLADVVRFQRELDQALLDEQRALRSLRDDETHLLSLEGALHTARGLTLDDEAAP